MIRIIALLLVATVITNSCQSPSDKVSEAFKTVDNSLKKSSSAIDSANTMLLKEIGENAACSIKAKADSLNDFIQNIKKEMEDYSAKKGTGPALDDLKTSNTIMIENKKGDILFTKLMDFNKTAINCETTKEARNDIIKIFGTDFFTSRNKFNDLHFKNAPTVAALTMLSSFQNKIKNIQTTATISFLKSEAKQAIK